MGSEPSKRGFIKRQTEDGILQAAKDLPVTDKSLRAEGIRATAGSIEDHRQGEQIRQQDQAAALKKQGS